tara:strand:+ start:709 stop:1128 length:420 start_codon:yes stop_codon:yes gene_type:complete
MRSDVLNENSAAFLNETVISPNHTETHVADVTLNAVQDVGGVHIMMAADKTFTLPAVAAGVQYTLVLGVDLGAAEYMRIAPNSSDKFIGGCNNAVQADNKYLGVTGAKKGACLKLEYGSAAGWFIIYQSKGNGIWAVQA